MTKEIFISYSSKEKSVADAVCAQIEERGHECWIAPRDILPGTEWGHEIVKGIENCKVMVLILSENSNKSQQVIREVERAVNHQKVIIPFMIENIQLSKSLEYYLGVAHWFDAHSGPLEERIPLLGKVVSGYLEKGEIDPKTAVTAAKGTMGTKSGGEKGFTMKLGLGVIVLALIGLGAFYGLSGGDSISKGTETIQAGPTQILKNLTLSGTESPAYIYIWKPWNDDKAPQSGWLTMENPYYKIDINLDHPYYLLYDKVQGKELLVYNDTVDNPTDMLTGSSLGCADLDAVNMVPYSSMAIHDEDGLEFEVTVIDEDAGIILINTKGWDFLSKDMRQGYDVEGENMFMLFAYRPYYIDAVEINNLQKQGFAMPVKHRNPTEITKDWVITADYDSAVIMGGDFNHMDKESEEEFLKVQPLGASRRPWHTGSASFSKMFPDHVLVGSKLGGGIIFSLPQGKFRFDDSRGLKGEQVVLEFLISVEKPQKATAFAVDPVNRNAFFYDTGEFLSVEGYAQSMQDIMERYGMEYNGELFDAQDWNVKRFAYVVSMTGDWYDSGKNKPKNSTIEVADDGLCMFKEYEDMLWQYMEDSKPLTVKAMTGG